MKDSSMFFPMAKFWQYTPYQYLFVLVWNLSELTGLPCPCAGYVFGVITGHTSKKIR